MELKEEIRQVIPPAEQSSSTSHEQVQYVLTKEEEENIIRNAKKQAAENLVWRMKDKGAYIDQIKAKLVGINWDEMIDKAELLKQCNLNKIVKIQEAEARRKEKEERKIRYERLQNQCDYKFFYMLMKQNCRRTGKELIENEDTLKLIKTVCFFMARDNRLVTELGYDSRKGLLIRGACGLGKTFLFRLVKENPIRPISMISLIEVSEIIQSEGWYNPPESAIWYFDDLGSERESMYFGNKVNWFKDYFEKFYMNYRDYSRLVVSTNLSFDELEQKYGYRFRSRVKEVLNIVDVTGEDLRK